MKTKEELSALKAEVETVNRKLRELTNEELANVVGGEDKYIQDCDPLNNSIASNGFNFNPFICNSYKPIPSSPDIDMIVFVKEICKLCTHLKYNNGEPYCDAGKQ